LTTERSQGPPSPGEEMHAGGMILAFEGMRPRIDPTAWIAPGAIVIGNVEVGAEASIWFGAVIRGDERDHPIRIGARTSIQDNCVIHVSSRGPTLIEADVTVGHGAVMESCRIGRGSLIGMNAVVLAGASVGERCLVAAGSVVAEGFELSDGQLAAGSPARAKRALDERSMARLAGGAAHYVSLSRRYRAHGSDAFPGDRGER